jgi:predicted CXXCH cytochrome family protein
VHPEEEKCLTCHSFHAKSGDWGKRFRGKEIRAEILCARCHEARRAGTVKEGNEKGTHVTTVSGGKEEICFRCHSIHQGVPGTALLSSGKSYSCLQCHPEQNTINETGGIDLAHPVFERVKKGRLSAVVRARNIKLGPTGEIVCASCHTMHKATPKTSLLVYGSEGGEICFWCHDKMRGKRHVKAQNQSVRCATCHPVHGRKNLGNDPWKTLCTECHARNAVHGPNRLDGAYATPRGLPGFDARGRKVALGAITCPTCHEPHGTERREKGLRKTYASSGFLCTVCHQDKETVALTPHDLRGISGKSVCEPCHLPHAGAAPWMLGVPVGTGERSEEACRFCHTAKGLGSPLPPGGHPVNMIVPRPLPEAFPLFGPSGERRRSGALTCATCHEVHGTGVLPTGGRGTGKLLRSTDCLPCHPGKETAHGKTECRGCHPPHGGGKVEEGCASCHKREDKGMAPVHAKAGKGCQACHTVHSVKNGKDAAVATCTACHQKEGRILGTVHAQQGGGACRPCHPAHRDKDIQSVRTRAWEDRFAPDLSCRRCHQEGGKGPQPKWLDHPKSRKEVPTTYGAKVTLETNITMFGKQLEAGRPLFPFFGEDGKIQMSGRIGCLTCHDPHAGGTVKPGDERRTASRYLRDPSGVFLADICVPCHGSAADEHARKFHEIPRKTE